MVTIRRSVPPESVISSGTQIRDPDALLHVLSTSVSAASPLDGLTALTLIDRILCMCRDSPPGFVTRNSKAISRTLLDICDRSPTGLWMKIRCEAFLALAEVLGCIRNIDETDIVVDAWIEMGMSLSTADLMCVTYVLRSFAPSSHANVLWTTPLIESTLSGSILCLNRSRPEFEYSLLVGEDESLRLILELAKLFLDFIDSVPQSLLVGKIQDIFSALCPYLQIPGSVEHVWTEGLHEDEDDPPTAELRDSMESVWCKYLTESEILKNETYIATYNVACNLINGGLLHKQNSVHYWRIAEAGLFLASLGWEPTDIRKERELVKLALTLFNKTEHILVRVQSLRVLSLMGVVVVRSSADQVERIVDETVPLLVSYTNTATDAILSLTNPYLHTPEFRPKLVQVLAKDRGAIEEWRKLLDIKERHHYYETLGLEETHSRFPEIVRCGGNDDEGAASDASEICA